MKKLNPFVKFLFYAVLVVAVIFAVYPIWFMFLASIRPGQSLVSLDLAGMFWPTEVTWSNYQAMLFGTPIPGSNPYDFWRWVYNSLKVAGLTTIATLFISTSAAFAVSRFQFRGREMLLIFFLAIQAFPGILSLIPIAQLLTAMGLFGTHLGLILAYSAGALVFNTWNLKGYFDTIPVELEEAAMIDGAGPIQSFIRIVLPLSTPALAVTAWFGFLGGFSEFVLASILLAGKPGQDTLPVALWKLSGSQSVPWGQFAAGALLISIPLLIIFFLTQRFLVSGLTIGGVKG
ncbi:MAG: sugar ABC transporter permease [Chloroflexi bacterium]|nr:MAG: sugar ABC transporter permease [Chloroflexota bacterium]